MSSVHKLLQYIVVPGALVFSVAAISMFVSGRLEAHSTQVPDSMVQEDINTAAVVASQPAPDASVPPELEPEIPSVLASTTWQWSETTYADNTSVKPSEPTEFVLAFGADNRFSATTNCNLLSGSFSASNTVFSTESLTATQMACVDEGQEEAFVTGLRRVTGFELTDGELVLSMPGETGIVLFRAVDRR